MLLSTVVENAEESDFDAMDVIVLFKKNSNETHLCGRISSKILWLLTTVLIRNWANNNPLVPHLISMARPHPRKT